MYAKYDRKESSEEILSGQDGEDSEEDGRVGFRVDSTPSDEDQLTLQGDMYNYDGGIALYAPDPGSPVGGGRIGGNKESQGGNIVGRWKHKFQKDSDVEFQLYYDRVERDEVVVDFTVDTIDSEFMHRYRFDKQLELQWGAGFRHIRDKIAQSSAVNYSPPEKNYDLYTGFAQLESELLEDQLTFTLGSKIESNEFSGFNYQPSASLIWSPKETQFVWVSASRAVRTPSRGGEDVSFVAGVTPLPGGGIGILQYDGADLPAEVLQAYELGYRFKPIDEVYVDIATFYNDYSQLVEASSAGNPIVPGGAGEPVIIPLTNFPTGEAKTYGVELSISSRPLNWLNLQASYWSIKIDQDEAQASAFETLGTAENKATLRALMDLSDEVELDLYYRYVDRIGGSGVPAYSELDSRVGWSPWDGVELALIANNLLDSGHQEATGDVLRLAATEVEREYWGRATITF
jgi:iron complex outermembrane receptor protein